MPHTVVWGRTIFWGLFIVYAILLALLVFQIKHFICDFLLQTRYMISRKGIYLHPLGLLHAGLHAVGSIPALIVLSRVPHAIALVLAGEFIVHYHTDWIKARLDQAFRLGPSNSLYWAIFGTDQMIHHITYLGMVLAIMWIV